MVIDAGSNDNRELREAERCVAVFVGVLVSAFKLSRYCTYVCVSFRCTLDRRQGARASAADIRSKTGHHALAVTLTLVPCSIGHSTDDVTLDA